MEWPRSDLQAAQSRRAAALGRAAQSRARNGRVEDYLFIGGTRLCAREAAERLGVTTRTIQRYKAAIRRGDLP